VERSEKERLRAACFVARPLTCVSARFDLLLLTRREVMSATVADDRISLPSIVNVRWRVDVTISSTQLSRVFKPAVLLQLTLSDGRVHDFECSIDKFHELRYAIAKSLKHAQDLQQHPTLTRDIE